MSSKRIIFFIGSLGAGGAERQISNLARGFAKRGYSVILITIFPGGIYASTLLNRPNLKLLSLNTSRGNNIIYRLFQLVLALGRLRKILKIEKPAYLYSMLHISNLFSWLAIRGIIESELIWGYRASTGKLNLKRLILDRFCALISPMVPLLIINSYAGLTYVKERGYRPKRSVVIPNGIDTDTFNFKPKLAVDFITEIGISTSNPLVGMVARLDDGKGYEVFLDAAKIIIKSIPNCRFICVGDGPIEYKRKLIQKTVGLDLDKKVFWLGNRVDMSAIYTSLNVFCSPSLSEGFSNVIGEAMACGTSCVVTDIGDSALIVGETGIIVPPGDAKCLSRAIQDSLTCGNKITRDIIRKRIKNNFSVEVLIDTTEDVIRSV